MVFLSIAVRKRGGKKKPWLVECYINSGCAGQFCFSFFAGSEFGCNNPLSVPLLFCACKSCRNAIKSYLENIQRLWCLYLDSLIYSILHQSTSHNTPPDCISVLNLSLSLMLIFHLEHVGNNHSPYLKKSEVTIQQQRQYILFKLDIA